MKLHFYDKKTGAIVRTLVLSHNPLPESIPEEIAKACPSWRETGLGIIAIDPDARAKTHSVRFASDEIMVIPSRAESSLFDGGFELALQKASRALRSSRPKVHTAHAPIDGRVSYDIGDPQLVGEVSVIITCHNYERYLEECLHSMMSEDAVPGELIIIHDACGGAQGCDADGVFSTSKPVPMITRHVKFHNASRTRNFGASLASLPWLLFGDADDVCGEKFISYLAAPLSDARLGFSFPSVRLIGDRDGGWDAVSFSRDDAFETNRAAISSIVRKTAFDRAGGFDINLKAFLDWDLWQRILQLGYTAVPCPNARLDYRIHDCNLSHKRTEDDYARVIAKNARVLLFTAWDSKEYCIKSHLKSIAEFTFARARLHLCFIDNSHSPSVRAQLVRWLSRHGDFASVQIIDRSDLPAMSSEIDGDRAQISRQMVELYGQIPAMTDCEFALAYENDVTAPKDAIERLLLPMKQGVGAVSAAVNRRPSSDDHVSPGLQAWRYLSKHPLRIDFNRRISITEDEPMPIDSSAWGCLLLRTAAWRKAPLRFDGPISAFDGMFGADLSNAGYSYLLEPRVRCHHMISEQEFV